MGSNSLPQLSHQQHRTREHARLDGKDHQRDAQHRQHHRRCQETDHGGQSRFTGILGGNTVVSDQEGWGIAEYGNDEPLCALTLMKGSLKVPADSAAAEYGNDLITD